MKKHLLISLILAAALLLSGCQRGLYLHFSGSKVVGADVHGEKNMTREPEGTDPSDMLSSEDETIEPSGEITWSEEPDTETSDKQTTNSEGSVTGLEESGDATEPEEPGWTDAPGPVDDRTTTELTPDSRTSVSRTNDTPESMKTSDTTKAPTTTKIPETTEKPTTTKEPATTRTPETTTARVTTQAPTTTRAPWTTTEPVTTQAPMTTVAPTATTALTTEVPTPPAPTTTEAATTTEDTVHVEANLEHLEILTLPTKTFYDQYNEIISTEGMTLLATWADGFEKVISDGWSIVSADGTPDPRTEREGEQTIYVTYGIKSVFYTITYRLAEDAPLRLVDSFSPGRVFYQGEYLKHLYTCAYVGSTRVEPSKLSFSPERLSGTGTVTVRISYGKHEAERSFTVVPASQFVLTQEDLDWPKAATIDSLPSDCVLTAAWVYEECLERAPDFRPMNHPLISDIIPESEFTFDPRDFRDWVYGYCEVTISCRGLTSRFSLF